MNTLTTSSNVNYIGSNIWTNLVMVVDKDNSQLNVYQDGTLIESLNMPDTISSTTSNMFIGKNETDDIYFKGNMDDIRVYNRQMTSNDVELLYNTKRNDKLMLQYDFEHYTTNSNIYDESGYINDAILQNSSSADLFDNSTKTISNTSLHTQNTISEFYQIASNNIVLGSNLNNCTFSAWVKTDQLNSFEPIISRDGIFSFGLNYGHACLRLGNDTNLIGLPSIQAASNSESSTEDSLKNNLMSHVHFDSEQPGVTRSNAPTTSLTDVVYDGGRALTLNSNNNQFVKLDGSQFASTNVNDTFSFSGWVKFDDVSGEMPIFKRGDDKIKFSMSNGDLTLSLQKLAPGYTSVNHTNYGKSPGLSLVTYLTNADIWGDMVYNEHGGNTTFSKFGPLSDNSIIYDDALYRHSSQMNYHIGNAFDTDTSLTNIGGAHSYPNVTGDWSIVNKPYRFIIYQFPNVVRINKITLNQGYAPDYQYGTHDVSIYFDSSGNSSVFDNSSETYEQLIDGTHAWSLVTPTQLSDKDGTITNVSNGPTTPTISFDGKNNTDQIYVKFEDVETQQIRIALHRTDGSSVNDSRGPGLNEIKIEYE